MGVIFLISVFHLVSVVNFSFIFHCPFQFQFYVSFFTVYTFFSFVISSFRCFFLSCPVYLNGLTLVMGFFGALVRPLLLLATPTTCCHKRESFESRTGWLPATETLLCC